ncbi:hypothetical protein K461DRAFT_214115, partial [Myriangium duriaei CBS 260.36]
YIVSIKSGANFTSHLSFVDDIHKKNNKGFEGVLHEYSIGNFQGYAGHFNRSVIEQIQAHEDVAGVEDDKIWPQATSVNVMKRELTQQQSPSYGLRLISQRNRGMDTYYYDSSAGSGTYAYVLSTGIANHPEFGGRNSAGFDATRVCACIRPDACKDKDGQGTHVAGIIGSRTYGVAKRCNLIAVKVASRGHIATSFIIEGLNWAVDDILRKRRKTKAVVNIALSVGRSIPLDNAVDQASSIQGVVVVVPAGDHDADAGNYSPGLAPGAITVGATDQTRRRTEFSNTGRAVTIFAPGMSIQSTSINRSTRSKSGTAQAAAYVTGLILYFQGLTSLPNARAARNHLLRNAIQGVVRSPGSSENLFAYNGN